VNENLIFLGLGMLVGVVMCFPAAALLMQKPLQQPVAWRKHNGQFWSFQKDVPQMRDAFKANGWMPLFSDRAAAAGPEDSA
jgi:hypothetical protein